MPGWSSLLFLLTFSFYSSTKNQGNWHAYQDQVIEYIHMIPISSSSALIKKKSLFTFQKLRKQTPYPQIHSPTTHKGGSSDRNFNPGFPCRWQRTNYLVFICCLPRASQAENQNWRGRRTCSKTLYRMWASWQSLPAIPCACPSSAFQFTTLLGVKKPNDSSVKCCISPYPASIHSNSCCFKEFIEVSIVWFTSLELIKALILTIQP